MKRRALFGAFAAAGAMGQTRRPNLPRDACGCAPQLKRSDDTPPGSKAFANVVSNLRITGLRVFGVTLPERLGQNDRPYVFVKIETNQGVVGWGEATLEGKAAAAMACVLDLKDLLIGNDPMQVEHLYQLLYVGSFYRGGPVLGSAISGIDQALWDIRGKVMGLPVYELLGGPVDPRGIRGYYHASAWTVEQAREIGAKARAEGVTALKFQLPDLLEWVETNAKIKRAVRALEIYREGLGPDIDFAVDFHARPSPTVAAILLREIEPLNLLFAEEICPPENIRAMQRAVRKATTPIATGERLIAAYGLSEIIDLGIVDILQPDIAHVGGITALWKVSAAADAAGMRMAPHACEGPIGGIASLHVDAACPNMLAQEICGAVESGERNRIWEELLGFPAMRMVGGRYPLPTRPGLGFDLNEGALKKYPFQGTRPFVTAFHEDGAVGSI
ncbi:MAG: galactonate dehydratase [Acidobacteria bacterium]|nr:galactonate dehydratase [Acidobacteriota bacterium]MBM3757987.1 galactonate dehydratase [Acidobacteriota bacterium]